MRPLLLCAVAFCVLTIALAAGQQIDRPVQLPPLPGCAADDPCPDPSRPWMRGTVEIQCAMPDRLDAAREAAPSKNIVPCGVCQHRCDPFYEHAAETQWRAWDPRCGARCSPKGCACKNPCDS